MISSHFPNDGWIASNMHGQEIESNHEVQMKFDTIQRTLIRINQAMIKYQRAQTNWFKKLNGRFESNHIHKKPKTTETRDDLIQKCLATIWIKSITHKNTIWENLTSKKLLNIIQMFIILGHYCRGPKIMDWLYAFTIKLIEQEQRNIKHHLHKNIIKTKTKWLKEQLQSQFI